ncbi:inorganic phosphate transporter [Phycicoccus endophyticus]|uniref:Inorganic phosphate transporter n=1 Tax=Phycicoccus endophyticus TaxID=1690220 RepID=A0A7G9R1U4_9MICO|nr:inorganic phosphate transporter [Phycicoccus endophyticus]NHI18633.1 inorganic phosphate transporter [Phycicoccus endophyticus]QNN49569.1 inorganic phosphate transporter [Phycicoccus endophyticus]GGL37649.1 inorganic phosphate transporter [Phycicoccus endophyticus]
MEWWPTALVVLLALGFTYTNGFHDAGNAIATSISTRALTPRIALALAATMNAAGGLAGVRVAETIGGDIVTVPDDASGTLVCVGALLGATAWNLLTWWRGLPSSSSHALVGGLGGAALVAGAVVHWGAVVDKVAIPMVLSPLVGAAGGFLLMALILRVFRSAAPGPTVRGFRYAQTVSAAAVAFGHGMQDASKTAGVVVLALVAGGHRPGSDTSTPWWVLLLLALVLGLGTYAGGWRIMRTLGRGLIHLDPPQGFAAETAAASVLWVATITGAPISTTHAITAAITGAGATRSAKAVRWGVARSIVVAWLLTVPGAALVAGVLVLGGLLLL